MRGMEVILVVASRHKSRQVARYKFYQVMDTLYSDDDRQYLQLMQDNIVRMANNSANCKNWMITLSAGFLALSCSINELNGWLILAIVPVFVFWYLDTLYLEMERKMRNRELDFIIKAKSGDFDAYKAALYNFAPLEKKNISEDEKEQGFVLTNDRTFSKSVQPLYLCFILLIVAVEAILNFQTIVALF